MIPSRSPLWFLVSIALIPLVYSSAVLDIALTPRAILLSLLTIATLVATWKQPVRTSPVLLAWAAYALFSIISIFVARNFGEAILRTSLVLLFGAWFVGAVQMMPRISM